MCNISITLSDYPISRYENFLFGAENLPVFVILKPEELEKLADCMVI